MSTVYFTRDISQDGLMKIYNAMNPNLQNPCGVKVSTGELGGHYFLDPELIKPVVEKVNGVIVECNTAYKGSRNATDAHKATIREHGFNKIAPVYIMDEHDEMEIPVTGGKHLTVNYVGEDLQDFRSLLVLSHFKGHTMAGFGGALKNIGIGIASSHGKLHIHAAGKSVESIEEAFKTAQEPFIESIAESAKSIIDYMGSGNMIYINIANNLSVDCDCDAHPAKPEMADIGIFGSIDPVAVDAACVGAVLHSQDKGKQALVRRIKSRKGEIILPYAEKLGIGSRKFDLVSLDEN